VDNADCPAATEAWKRWHEHPTQTSAPESPSSSACVNFGDEIAAAAKAYGVDPVFLSAIAAQETGGPESDSGNNRNQKNGSGKGLFQIDTKWHHDISLTDLSDPGKNAMYAARMVRDLIKANGGDEHAAASEYNSGDPDSCGTKTTWPLGRLCYGDSVMAHKNRLIANKVVIKSCSNGAAQ
jgi:soluble lytic murein transglycosylase-like protein